MLGREKLFVRDAIGNIRHDIIYIDVNGSRLD